MTDPCPILAAAQKTLRVWARERARQLGDIRHSEPLARAPDDVAMQSALDEPLRAAFDARCECPCHKTTKEQP